MNEKFKEDVCCVCYEEFKPDFVPLNPCGHYIHTLCVLKTGKDLCPICRGKVFLNIPEPKHIKKRDNIFINMGLLCLYFLYKLYIPENEILTALDHIILRTIFNLWF